MKENLKNYFSFTQFRRQLIIFVKLLMTITYTIMIDMTIFLIASTRTITILNLAEGMAPNEALYYSHVISFDFTVAAILCSVMTILGIYNCYKIIKKSKLKKENQDTTTNNK